jgi:hypothetical protein
MTTYTDKYSQVSVTLSEGAEALYQGLKASIRASLPQGSDRLYTPVDARGAGLIDNYDNPYGCALFITGEGRVIAHSCNYGSGVYVTHETAKRLAGRFFTGAGDQVVSMIINDDHEGVAY